LSENLWPKFDNAGGPRSPKAIIEEAGSGLKERTGGVLEFYRTDTTIKDNEIKLTFTIWSGVLRYHYPFIRATFAVDPPYPVTLVADKMPDSVANDENELKAALAKIFNSPTTKDTVQRLMTLATT